MDRQSLPPDSDVASIAMNESLGIQAAELEARADWHFTKREFRDALACQLQAVAIRQRANDVTGAGNGAQNAGLLYFLLGHHEDAIRAYGDALESRTSTDDFRGQAVTLARMAEVYQHIGRHGQAVQLLEQSLDLLSRAGTSEDIGTALNNIAVSYRELGEWDKAMRCYERSLENRRQTGDIEGLAATLHNLGVLYSDQSHDDHARKLLEEARGLRETMDDMQGVGQTTLRLGMLHEKHGDFPAAIAAYERALTLARRADIQSKDDEAAALLNLADVHSNQGNIERALALLGDAERLFNETGMTTGVAMAQYGRGSTLAAAGRMSEALAWFEAAQSHFLRLNDRPRLISTFIAMGTLLSRTERHWQARDAFSSALELQRELALRADEAITLQLIDRESAALGDAGTGLNRH